MHQHRVLLAQRDQLAGRVKHRVGIGQRRLFRVALCDVSGQGDVRAQLAVHLDHDVRGIVREIFFVRDRPRRLDQRRRMNQPSGQFLLLGSATGVLLQQSSESLAGRVAYVELPALQASEIFGSKASVADLNALWMRGGFPLSWLAASDADSMTWREVFITTYLEKDIPALGPRIPATTLRRLWTMLAHHQGELLDQSKLASALAISGQTVSRYIDLLCDLMLVRRLPAWHGNVGKRLIRSPKVYVRDSGLVHALLGLSNLDAVLGHPVAGPSWEGFVLETVLAQVPRGTSAHFYRSAAGAEIDLVLTLPGGEVWAIEIKRSSAPKLERGFHFACADLAPARRFVIYPGHERFPLDQATEAIEVVELGKLLQAWA